jgi:hypothetical protein
MIGAGLDWAENENPPKSLTPGDNQLSIVGFNLIQIYRVQSKIVLSIRSLDNTTGEWAFSKLESLKPLKLKIPRSSRLRGIIMSIVGFNQVKDRTNSCQNNRLQYKNVIKP